MTNIWNAEMFYSYETERFGGFVIRNVCPDYQTKTLCVSRARNNKSFLGSIGFPMVMTYSIKSKDGIIKKQESCKSEIQQYQQRKIRPNKQSYLQITTGNTLKFADAMNTTDFKVY